MLSMFDILPSAPAELAVRKLQNRRSYMAKAPFQRRSKKRALGDTVMKLCPATWLGPVIINAHDKYEYKKDRQRTEEVHVEFLERRKNSVSTNDAVLADMETYPAPIEWCPYDGRDWERDPWRLPPMEEIH
ncbi:hypothetical protein MMC28_005283 [Mycoblastus sanguinarius]|nr:hypothetical protein [Mycoblastus sanguinarius]